jgi:hypothetical protein
MSEMPIAKSSYDFSAFNGDVSASSKLTADESREVYKLGMEGSFFPFKHIVNIVGPIFMLLFFASIFLVDWVNSNILFFLFFFFALGFAIYSIYMGFKAQSEVSRYIKFAEDNNLTFSVIEKDFKINHIPLFNDSFDNARYKIFNSNKNPNAVISNFRFRKKVSTKNGTRTETYWRGMITIPLPKLVPHILVVGDKEYTPFANEERMRMGAGVEGKISIYAPNSLHREVLLILTPDVLDALVNNGIEGEIHIAGDKLLFLFDKPLPLAEPATWEMFDRLQATVGRQVLEQVERYSASAYVRELLINENGVAKDDKLAEKIDEALNVSKKYGLQVSLKQKSSQINVSPLIVVLILGLISSWLMSLIFFVIL